MILFNYDQIIKNLRVLFDKMLKNFIYIINSPLCFSKYLIFQGLKKKSDDLLKKKELLIKEVKVRQAYHDRICNNLIEIHGVSAVSEYLEKSITESKNL